MHAFAVCQALRMIFVVMGITIMCLNKVDKSYLPAAFLFSELLVLILLSCLLAPKFLYCENWDNKLFKILVREHFSFGIRGFASGTLIELNTRIDILIISIYLTNYEIGIYSFASLFLEGYTQLIGVVKTILNPILARSLKLTQNTEVISIIKNAQPLIWGGMFIMLILTILFSIIATHFFLTDSAFKDSIPILSILMAGVFAVSGFLAFDTLIIQAGYPGNHTCYVSLFTLTNIILNFIVLFNCFICN
jgi:O-antigen/teichoic acid export membrane protein